jgi:hypothetical protein
MQDRAFEKNTTQKQQLDAHGNHAAWVAVGEPCSPSLEPNIFFRVEELLKYLETAETLRVQLYTDVFGCLEPETCVESQGPKLYGLEFMLANACTKAACLAGGLRKINQRMGCKEI